MNPRERKGMYGIICDGGASKFSCLVESLNVVRRGLLYDAKCRAFGGPHDPKMDWQGGRQGNEQTVLHFRGIVQLWERCLSKK